MEKILRLRLPLRFSLIFPSSRSLEKLFKSFEAKSRYWAYTVSLITQKIRCVSYEVLLKKHPIFLTLRSALKIKKKNPKIKNVKNYMDSKKLMNLFEIKKSVRYLGVSNNFLANLSIPFWHYFYAWIIIVINVRKSFMCMWKMFKDWFCLTIMPKSFF